MSLLDRLFRRKPPEPIRDVAALTAPLAVPALRLKLGNSSCKSHVGGLPALPEGTSWPEYEGSRLGFLARLSLEEIQAALPVPWLPKSGALLFFYDLERQPWGYDPNDRGRWAVLHVDDLDNAAIAPDTGARGSAPAVPFRYIEFQPIQSFPSWEREEVNALSLNDAEVEELLRLTDAPFGQEPKHQLAGYPSPVQDDEMELEAQLASNGLLYCGDGTGYNDPRAEALRPGAEDWRLLLQFDSDDNLGLMRGDAGMLYFWVQESAARTGDFRTVWLVLQCC
jgi:uncharacterized protein YwqG